MVDHVLGPLGIAAAAVFFTGCLPTYFVKDGTGSQGERVRTVYQPFRVIRPSRVAASGRQDCMNAD